MVEFVCKLVTTFPLSLRMTQTGDALGLQTSFMTPSRIELG